MLRCYARKLRCEHGLCLIEQSQRRHRASQCWMPSGAMSVPASAYTARSFAPAAPDCAIDSCFPIDFQFPSRAADGCLAKPADDIAAPIPPPSAIGVGREERPRLKRAAPACKPRPVPARAAPACIPRPVLVDPALPNLTLEGSAAAAGAESAFPSLRLQSAQYPFFCTKAPDARQFLPKHLFSSGDITKLSRPSSSRRLRLELEGVTSPLVSKSSVSSSSSILMCLIELCVRCNEYALDSGLLNCGLSLLSPRRCPPPPVSAILKPLHQLDSLNTLFYC